MSSRLMIGKEMKVIPPGFRKLWKEWDLRVMVLLSLALQIILIVLGRRRRFDSRLWIRIVAWSAYLAADSVATFALGILSGNLTDLFDEHAKALGANTELEAFWAPFLLLHLGGPDTTTAYAFEDNELWLRHFLKLIVQTIIAFYVFLMAWTGGSRLSMLSIPMFLVGLIKYGERTWVLWSASYEKLRQSLFSSTRPHPYDDIEFFTKEYYLKITHGYVTRPTLVSEVQLRTEKLLRAHGCLRLTKGLFLDAALRSRDRDSSKSVFRNLSFEDAFKVIEMELGMVYDLLYTKAPLLYTLWGLPFRLLTFFVTGCALVLFTFLQRSQKQKYSKVDLFVTFSLLIVAIILEIYSAVFMLIPSDQFLIWLTRRCINSKVVNAWKFIPKSPRWSRKMCQLSLLSFIVVEHEPKPLPCRKILKLLGIEKKLEKQWWVAYEEVPEDLKEVIFRFFEEKARETKPWESNSKSSFIMVPRAQGNVDDDDKLITEAAPNFEDDLGKSILFWHIITEVFYCLDEQIFEADIAKHCESIKQISRYMFYLLLVHPSMFSIGVLDLSSFEYTVHRFRDEIQEVVPNYHSKYAACRDLVKEVYYSKFRSSDRLLYDASRAAASLRKNLGEQAQAQGQGLALAEKWNELGGTWLKILAFAARKSKGNQHGQQLRRGGELLTHVWLLMAHFGLTDHFPMS
ncbi:DUF4220 domain-containing protein [Citrus sinensis]|uniref:DUF4220 domain-containing protein n=2 Tax=Citrus TaxID=2706 RepID=A0A2H5PHZ1_CITUN|nr:DUF4220 domain-containing protein [Citrus sinensis]GAY51978.1 hypothetical protein CUMW_138440 [Citrus unshiu]